MTFTRRKFNRKFRGGKKKTIRKKRKTRRKRGRGTVVDRNCPDVNGKSQSWDDVAKKCLPVETAIEEEYERYDDTTGTWSGGGKRKSKRRKSKRKKSKRKKRRKKKTKKRRRRKRQRGGYKCDYPSNVGEIFTGIKLNKNPYLPDPINSNTNIRTSHKQKGGGFMDNWGMGDALLGWYKGTNAVSNIPIRYKGGKPLMNANPMHQPGLLKEEHIHKTANIPVMYRSASDKAVDAKFTVN